MIQMSSKELKDNLFSLCDKYNHAIKTFKIFSCSSFSVVSNDTNNQNDDKRSNSMATHLHKLER